MFMYRLYVMLRTCYLGRIQRAGLARAMARTVLLLEDDPMIRDLLDAVLSDEGYDVCPCSSRDQLLAAARDIPTSLALVDFWGESHQVLSDDERHEVVELARTVPTILVSGRAWLQSMCADNLGLCALVHKPFDVDQLTGLVAECSARLGNNRTPTTAA